MTLIQNLKQLGLEEKEAEVYLAALELGPASIQSITKKSGVKRSTVYEMLKNLKTKGLVAETTKGKRKLIVASEPEKLKRDMANRERLLNQILPDLNSISNISGLKPKITFYEGREGLREIYRLSLQNKVKTADWISPIKSIVETVGEDFLNEYIEKRAKMKYWVRSIQVTEQQYDTYKYLDPRTFDKTYRRVRFTPRGMNVPNVIGLWDNKVAVISSHKEGIGFIIESEDFFKSIKALYELLWNASKPYGDMDFNGLGQGVGK